MSPQEKETSGLDDILTDREQGAAELLGAVLDWMESHPDALGPTARPETLNRLRTGRPAMAGFASLADRLERDPNISVPRLRKEIAAANQRTVETVAKRLFQHGPATLVTLSRSSLVLDLVRRHADSIRALHVLESMPGGEGRWTADRARASVQSVVLHKDVDRTDAVRAANAGVIGADTVFADGSVLNKVGSRALAETLHAHGKPCYVLASEWKRSRLAPTSSPAQGDDEARFETVPGSRVTLISATGLTP